MGLSAPMADRPYSGLLVRLNELRNVRGASIEPSNHAV